MSLFAGIFSVGGDFHTIEQKTAELVKKAVPCADKNLETFSSPYFFLVKSDFGAFGEPAYLSDAEKGVAAMAGAPLLKHGKEESYSRFSDLCKLSEYLYEGKTDILTFCNGTYSICCYNSCQHSLILATDKFGVRPLYFYYNKEFLYFSSCLNILEAFDNIPKSTDLRAFVEEYALGIPLGNKTQYCEIKVLRDGQFLRCENKEVRLSFYFRWDHLPVSLKSEDLILKECYSSFKAAVASRSKHSDKIFALLSGGLDSRCVVSMLHLLDKEITAFNSFLPREQDQIFAEKYANLIKINYISAQRSPKICTTESLLAYTIANACQKANLNPPWLVFSGDGGSVGVGHVYMDETLVNLLNKGDIDSAIHYFLKKRTIPQKIIKSGIWSEIKDVLFDGIKKEIQDVASAEPARAFFLFLLRNDQRRHLHKYYENISQIRSELLLPFFDSRLTEVIVISPVEFFLNHKFYHKWLLLFPEHTRSVPWQTYPGHVPCPISEASDYSSQWQTSQKDKFIASKSDMKKCLKILTEKNFPDKFISRHMVFIAILLHWIKTDDYSHIFNFCEAFYNQYSKCESVNFTH